MKKILPQCVLLISICLFSFKSVENAVNTQIIDCNDGTIVIPSKVGISDQDQRQIASILGSYGSKCGTFTYKNAGGSISQYNPLDPGTVNEIDREYGSDIANAGAGCGYVFFVSDVVLDKFSQYAYIGSSTTAAVHDKLTPILVKYGYKG